MHKKVTIYTKTGCPYAEDAKKDLTERDIPFVEVNISEQPEAEKKVEELAGRRMVPVMVEGDKITVGFRGRG